MDSMNNDFIFNENENPDFSITPNIGSLVKNGASFTMAEAVMPTKTQVNHVTIVSGSYADNIGIVGNYVFDPSKNSKAYMGNIDFPWKNPSLIKADTIFKAMEREDSDYTSLIVAGEKYVGGPLLGGYQSFPAYTFDNAEERGVVEVPEVL
ncbi:alkaline phosphatase family protein, partial [Candidatus Bathyarchaeota archaeon]|nr:alkaline phosphatase family protein [Candidatus Bathyarchaeota archaeon]